MPPSSTSRTSTPGIGRPIDPALTTGEASVVVTTGAVSVRPYPSRIVMPTAVCTCSSTAGGSEDAPEASIRTPRSSS